MARDLCFARWSICYIEAAYFFPALQSGTIDGTEWVGPWHDMAAGFYKVAKFYYWPGWHEPGTTGEVMVNLKAWEGLEEHKAIFQAAIAAEAWQEFADFNAHNADALTELIDTHGVQLRRYSNELLIQVARVAEAVVAEIGNADQLTGNVYESYLDFRRKAVGWRSSPIRASWPRARFCLPEAGGCGSSSARSRHPAVRAGARHVPGMATGCARRLPAGSRGVGTA